VNVPKNLLPNDGFNVSLANSLPQNYMESLYHLYLPLIGRDAVNLYVILMQEMHMMSSLAIDRQTHHTLMNHLNVSLHNIYESRVKLEALGLMRTYKHEHESGRHYTYELIPPFTPENFFADVMLSELLVKHIGQRRFTQLRQLYQIKQTTQTTEGMEITAQFHDVFTTNVQANADLKANENESIIYKQQRGINVQPIDFSLIAATLKQRNIPVARVLTETNERILTQLVHLYDLEMYELEKALLWALTEEHTLDIEQLKAACHDFFMNKSNNSKIKLTFNQPTKNEGKKKNVQQSPKERLISRLESITPKQLLEDLSEGHHASEQDLKMIREIMIKQGLTTPVMNVLIHFTLLKTNMQLSRPYMEKIASHWSRAKLKTAREAMDFALQQSQKLQPAPKQHTYRQRQKEEVIPDWFKRRTDEVKESKQSDMSEDQRQAEKEMAAILKKYNSQP